MDVEITALVAGGLGLGRLDSGKVVLVDGALPGELVRVDVVQDRKDVVRATTVEVLRSSTDRVAPPCVHHREGCGGCDLMHAEPAAQGPLKRSIVVDALRRIGRIDDPPVAPVVRSVAPWGYRTSLRATAAADGRLGFHRRRSADVVPTPGCLVAADDVRTVLARATDAPGAEVVVRPDLVATVHGRPFRVGAGSFFQSGIEAAELLVDVVDELVGDRLADGVHLVDLYAGVGVLGGCLLDRHPGVRLTAVESTRSAVDDLRHNLPSATVVRTDVARWKGRADVVVADPARSGLGRSATAALAAAGPSAVVLVSCDPASLARDVGLLRGHGFVLDVVEVLDLFPQTSHVETVGAWSRS
jgi:23S rRNA (uracil1939-C5)-methyltransferase